MKRSRRRLAILWDAVLSFNRNDGWAMAGYIAFSCILSLFPFLIAAATLIGIAVGQARSGEIIDAIFNIVPAHVALTIEPVPLRRASRALSTRSAGPPKREDNRETMRLPPSSSIRTVTVGPGLSPDLLAPS